MRRPLGSIMSGLPCPTCRYRLTIPRPALWNPLPHMSLQVLGFPCNQFGGQEPGNNDDIKAFAAREYGITFPLFSKVDVNGPNASPIFTFLRNNSQNSRDTQWNFEKVGCAPDFHVLANHQHNLLMPACLPAVPCWPRWNAYPNVPLTDGPCTARAARV